MGGYRLGIVGTVAALLTAALPVNTAVAAQLDTQGTIQVRVTDEAGYPLPGVEVVLSGAGSSRGFTNAPNGDRAFTSMPPGPYSGVFVLPGFKTLVAEDEDKMTLKPGDTLSISVIMELTDEEVTITVSAEDPSMSVTSANTNTLVMDQIADRVPSAAGLWAGALDIPAITRNFDIGGSDSGQQMFAVYGQTGGQTAYSLAAVNDGDAAQLSEMGQYFSFDAVEDISVMTTAQDIGLQLPGASIAMVVKSGANDFRGGGRFLFEAEQFVGRNVNDALAARNAGGGNPNTRLVDINLEAGGPIWRDRAWFYGNYWRYGVERLIAGLPGNERDELTLDNVEVNVTTDISDKHRVTFGYTGDWKLRDNRRASALVAPESAWLQDSFTQTPRLQWLGVFSPNTSADVQLATFTTTVPLVIRPGAEARQPASLERRTGTETGLPAREQRTDRDSLSLRGTLRQYASGLGGQHTFEFGAELQRATIFQPERRGGPLGFQQQFLDGSPDRVVLWNTPPTDVRDIEAPNGPTMKESNWAAFASDTWTVMYDRLTVSGGVRFDSSTTRTPPQARPASAFPELGPQYQAATFAPLPDITDWKRVVGRASASIWPFDYRGPTITLGYRRYSDEPATPWASFVNPGGYGYQLHNWIDTNGDGTFQAGEQGALLRRFFPGISSQIDADLAPPKLDEFSAMIEQELPADVRLTGTFTYRGRGTFVEDVNIGVPYGPILDALSLPGPDPYTPVATTDPGPDGVLGTADDGGPLTIYSQDPATFGNDLYQVMNPQRAGFSRDLFSRTRKVFTLELVRPMLDSWSLRVRWDVSRARDQVAAGRAGASILDSPNDDINIGGLDRSDRTHVVNVVGMWRLPEPLEVFLTASLVAQTGEPLIRSAVLPNAGSEPLAQGFEPITVAARGADSFGPQRLDNQYELNLRAERDFWFSGTTGLSIYVDVFNLLNNDAITDQRVRSSTVFGDVVRMVPPRTLRLGAQVRF